LSIVSLTLLEEPNKTVPELLFVLCPFITQNFTVLFCAAFTKLKVAPVPVLEMVSDFTEPVPLCLPSKITYLAPFSRMIELALAAVIDGAAVAEGRMVKVFPHWHQYDY